MSAATTTNRRRLLRVGTYNIHGAKGLDGVRDLDRIAGVIGTMDLVALQEVRGSFGGNQAKQLAMGLGLDFLFVPTRWRWFHGDRGNAVLTRFPLRNWTTEGLEPHDRSHRFRNFSVVEIGLGAEVLSVLFTHLHTRDHRSQQLDRVLERFARLPSPALLLGDLNTRHDDPGLTPYLVGENYRDAVNQVLAEHDPVGRVDWILTKGLDTADGGCIDNGASDHPFYWVELELSLS